jgi:AraC family transcriptional regulator of adaptative response/methylated-DNA-[protein]-cysteine methyltransferase
MGDLRRRFPNATIAADDAALAETVRAIVAFIEEPAAVLTLPLDLRGTVFQQRVWTALRSIPPGETRTYAQVAAGIGAPRAVRAVARSCATNPVSLAVPCHRVVGSGGDLCGYRWGLPRKRALLARERELAK